MALNSVHTNVGAQVALQSLNKTSTELQSTQKRISTGLRVADATDDGAAFAVAQRVRSDVGALTTVNQQLGSAKGLIDTATKSIGKVSDFVNQAKSLLVSIGTEGITQESRDGYVNQYKDLVRKVANEVDGSTYNGQSLLGKTSGTVATDTSVITSETGSKTTIKGEDLSGLAGQLAGLIGATFTRDATTGADTFTAAAAGADQTAAATALNGNGYSSIQTDVNKKLSQAANDSNFITATITSNSDKIDSLNAGIGALVDADLSKESANLQALQIRQQLGTQALGLANQAPQSLLSLFR